jgi:HD-GYP domain-containing protein (c-di-GMP phosphodiesterase class II)
MMADGDILRIAASRGIPAETAQQVAVPVGDRICGRVFATGKPIILQNVRTELPEEALGIDATSHAVASFPLMTARMTSIGRKIGVLNATDKPDGSFSPWELTELEFVSEAAAISLSSQMTFHDLQRANLASIITLAMTMEAKDPYTHGHSLRVESWAECVGRELGLSGATLQSLSYAAKLHDIGKLAVPDHILQANRRLTDVEWAVIREHPRRGAELLKHLAFLKDGQPAVLHHHERLDGTGYPDGLKGEEIPLEARILAVVDAYDAMTSARAYRPAMSHETAVAELRRCSSIQFDPKVVESLLRVMEDEVTAAVGDSVTAGA